MEMYASTGLFSYIHRGLSRVLDLTLTSLNRIRARLDRARLLLTKEEIVARVDELLKEMPKDKHCKFRFSVLQRLKVRGFVEVSLNGRHRITEKGSEVASALLRQLEVPLALPAHPTTGHCKASSEAQIRIPIVN